MREETEIDPIFQVFSRFEMWHVLSAEFNTLTGFRIATKPRGPIVEGETAKPANLNSIAFCQYLCHLVQNQLDRQLNIFDGQLVLD